jgi:hypothetical protein
MTATSGKPAPAATPLSDSELGAADGGITYNEFLPSFYQTAGSSGDAVALRDRDNHLGNATLLK